MAGVLQNGPAAQAGIHPGDVIVDISDKPVNSVSELLSAVAALKPGKPAKFTIVRADAKLTVTVTPGVRQRAKVQAPPR